ncbi:uncharacterized protein B0H18DRAFT_993847 [Fomitopsis serialis]|uniref:uncharacterized protein n=1 Tax=Fomitopsis serialis TaxID=139415 RepID=UPI0020076BB1|nr:uncharacterized protein B0H18DRAFT_993847 [Neoantrodia serialis]KAH9930222.1 hypothetical protein B0H18DRAFT_993847 [Neoantrodia serialis]
MVEQYRVKHGLADARNEFVLTENGLGLTEGASRTSTSFIVDMMSLGAPRAALTLTQFFPITPKLVIILRSPVAEQARCQAYEGPGGISYFDDIPRTSPKTTYIPPFPPGSYDWEQRRPEKMSAEDRKKKEDFQVRGLLNGVPLGSRLRDRFIFAIEDLTEDQAQRVNTLLLTHCKETISFYTPACLVRAIDAFERDTMLTIFEKKRYASLKAKLLAEGTRPSPMPTSPYPPASPGGEHSPRKLIPTSPDPSGSELAAQALSMGTSLVLGFKGAFGRKARSAPTSNVQDASVGEPASLTAQTVVSQEQARLDVSHTEVLCGSTLANTDTTQITPVDNTPHITGEPPLPPVIHDRASNDQPSAREVNVPGLMHDGLPPPVAKMAPSAPAIAAQWNGLHAALPGLRGAFKRRPNVISTETPSLIATQPLLASPAPLLQPTIDVSQSPDSEARPKAQADIDTASASSLESSAESYMDSTRTDLGSEAHLDPSTGHPVEQYTETNTDSRDGTYRGTHSTPEPRSSSARWFVSRMLWTKPAKLAKAVASIFCCCK